MHFKSATSNSFAIVVLSYNHPEHTQHCLQTIQTCVQKQSLAFNLKKSLPIILIHNGSQKKKIESLQKLFPQIDHQILDNNKGYSGGANFGLRYAFQKYSQVLFITNDCKLVQLNLTQIQQLDPGFYAPLIKIRETEKIDSMGGEFIPHFAKLKHHINKDEMNLSLKNKNFYVPGSSFIIDKTTFVRTQGFDESLGTYWEDVDLSARIQKLKLTVGFTEAVILTHKIGKTCRKDTFYTLFLYNRNQMIVSRRHTKIWLRPVLEAHLFFNFLKSILRLIIFKRWQDLKLLNSAMKEATIILFRDLFSLKINKF